MSTIRAIFWCTLACLILSLNGCGEPLASDCGPIPDGTYRGSAGDTYSFAGGSVSGWSCAENASCPETVTCAPVGETVYTVTFERSGGGLVATTAPGGPPVALALSD
jgi:hypothetical protein